MPGLPCYDADDFKEDMVVPEGRGEAVVLGKVDGAALRVREVFFIYQHGAGRFRHQFLQDQLSLGKLGRILGLQEVV